MKAFYKGTVDVLCKDNECLISPVSPIIPQDQLLKNRLT